MLDKLIAIQRREGLSDGPMAERLGLSRSGWNLMRRGKLAFSAEVAIRAAGEWPELTRDLLNRAESAALARTDGPTISEPTRGAA